MSNRDQGTVRRDAEGITFATPPVLEVLGYDKVTIGNTSTGLTLANIPRAADTVLLRSELNDVRWRGDGQDPTASTGSLLRTDDAPLRLDNLTVNEITALRFIRAGGSGGEVHVTYLRLTG
jgi:hypothetical protein